MYDERYFVTVSDLIINKGSECTLLDFEPEADHLVIEVEEGGIRRRGSVMIKHQDEVLVYRFMTGGYWGDDVVPLTVGDLDDALWKILNKRFQCEKCKYWTSCLGYFMRCEKEKECAIDWHMYRMGECPCREEKDEDE